MFTSHGKIRTINGALRTGSCACCDKPPCLNYPTVTSSGWGCSTVFYGYTLGGFPPGEPSWEGSAWMGGTVQRPICTWWGTCASSVGVSWNVDDPGQPWHGYYYYSANFATMSVTLDRYNYDPGKVCVKVAGELHPSPSNPMFNGDPPPNGFYYAFESFSHWDCFIGGRDISVSGRTATVSIDNQACRHIDYATYDPATNSCTYDANGEPVEIGFGLVPGSYWGGSLDTIIGCPCTLTLEFQL